MITCTKCSTQIKAAALNTSSPVACGACGTPVVAHVFPAALKSGALSGQESADTVASESGCFYHPDKKAVVPCASCGRFLCALCDTEIDGRHICLPCLQAGKKSRQIKHLESHVTLYDGIAIRLALMPFTLILWFTTFIAAPASLFLVLRYWKKQGSVLPRSKIRFVAAFVLSLTQLAGWTVGGYLLFEKLFHS